MQGIGEVQAVICPVERQSGRIQVFRLEVFQGDQSAESSHHLRPFETVEPPQHPFGFEENGLVDRVA